MLLPKGTIVAVADGEKFNLFSNTGDEASPRLTAMPEPEIETVNKGSGASHQSSSANPDQSQAAEDGFAGGIAGLLKQTGAKWRDFRSHYHRCPAHPRRTS